MKEIQVNADNGNYYIINEAFNGDFLTRKYSPMGLEDTFKGNTLRGAFDEIALDIETDKVLEQGSFN